jgi:hypothetical protein
MNNVRIWQNADLSWSLLWDDEKGAPQWAGPFDTAAEAEAELVLLRAPSARPEPAEAPPGG